MPSTVSVALCTHNGAQYIDQQVRSILAQTVAPDEIVLSDDASTDDTVEQVRRAVEGTGVPLRVLANPSPLGVSRNFEQAILASTSTFVALSDQDDVWHPDRIERALELFAERPGLSLVHSDARLIDGEGAPLAATLFEALGVGGLERAAIRRGDAIELLLRRNLVTGATVVLRRSFADLVTPFPPAWLHDEWLAIAAAARVEIDVIGEPLIDYRQHGGNQVGAEKLTFVGRTRRMLEPGAERSARLLERAQALAERLPEIAPALADAVTEKRQHERMRSALSPHRLSRIVPVLRELRTGRYRTFGRGATDAVRDLLQPLDLGR